LGAARLPGFVAETTRETALPCREIAVRRGLAFQKNVLYMFFQRYPQVQSGKGGEGAQNVKTSPGVPRFIHHKI